jgi:hypothetical protein
MGEKKKKRNKNKAAIVNFLNTYLSILGKNLELIYIFMRWGLIMLPMVTVNTWAHTILHQPSE